MQGSNVKPKDILCVSFSSAMHSLIAVDRAGKPLTECITWVDNRSSDWVEKIKKLIESLNGDGCKDLFHIVFNVTNCLLRNFE
jgi:sugar (pentulose or hexulose) kinase